jgi:anti-anti-sigma factor
LDIATAPELSELVGRLIRNRHPVALDMAAVTFIDSTGLNALMDAHLEAEREGCDFSLRRASPAVQRVIDLAGVGRLFN